MRWIADVGIPAFLGVVIIILLFVMKGTLSFVIGLPVWMIGSALVVFGVPIFIMLNLLTSFYRYGKEGFVFADARRRGLLVINDVEIGTNNAEFILGEKTDPKNPLFKDEKSGVKVDPSMVSAYAEPLRYSGGLNIVGYAYNNFLPQTTRNHLAFKAIVDYFTENENKPDIIDPITKEQVINPSKELAFFTPNEKIELISKPEHFLEADLKTMVSKYFKTRKGDQDDVVYFRQFSKDGKWYEQIVKIPILIHAVQQMKTDISKLPISTGYFCQNEAFRYNNVAYTAQHLSALKSLLTQLLTEDILGKIDRNWFILGVCGIMGCVTLCIYVMSQTVFK